MTCQDVKIVNVQKKNISANLVVISGLSSKNRLRLDALGVSREPQNLLDVMVMIVIVKVNVMIVTATKQGIIKTNICTVRKQKARNRAVAVLVVVVDAVQATRDQRSQQAKIKI